MATTAKLAVAASTPTTKRQSCNRCYGQKLRCTRQGNELSCNRCSRQGAQCFSLPKGRPPSGRPPAAALARLGTSPRTPVPCHQYQAASQTTNISEAADSDFNNDIANTNDYIASTLTASSFNQASAGIFCSPSTLDPSGLRYHLPSSDPHSHSTSRIDEYLPHAYVVPNTCSSWRNTGEQEDYESMSGSFSISSNSDSNDSNRPKSNTLFSGVPDCNTSLPTSPSSNVAQLSQLSTQLYSIYHSSCALTRTAELSYAAPQTAQAPNPLLDDACYKIVAGWLYSLFARTQPHVPLDSEDSTSSAGPTGETLQSIFSASHYLLDILRRLQRELGTLSTSEADLWTGLSPGPLHSAQVSDDHIATYFNRTSYTSPSNDCSSTVVRDLVLDCHTQILNIHVTVLIALQHDAVLKDPRFKSDGHVEDDTRIALVVQLCAYLLERQRQAVHAFLAQVPPPTASQMYSPACSATSSMSKRAMMGHLEVDVEERLARIRQMLRI